MSTQPIHKLSKTHQGLPTIQTGWKELEVGGGRVSDMGNSELYGTGNWVSRKLCFEKKNCINCALCWPVCPDDAIILDKEGSMVGVDLDHCKDCGLCIEACPTTKKPDVGDHALRFEEDVREDF